MTERRNIPYSGIGVLIVKKMLIFTKLSYKFHTIPLKLLSGLFIVWQTASKSCGRSKTQAKDIHTNVGEQSMSTYDTWNEDLL